MTTFINLTPHDITVEDVSGVRHTFVSTGHFPVARVETNYEEVEDLFGFRHRVISFGSPSGIPDPLPGTIFIVSGMVKGATSRPDVVAPDTGPDAFRNEKGHIVAVRGFV